MSTYEKRPRMPYDALTQACLKELLRYNRTTGIFTWRVTNNVRKKGDKAGYVNKIGYVLIGIGGTSFYAHRLVWLYVHGRFPSKDVDHRDGNPSNNALKNLRESTPQQNGHNRRKSRSSVAPYKGITKYDNRFSAYIRIENRGVFIGSHPTPEGAARLYDAAARKHFGKFARVNFPRRGEMSA